MKRLRVSDSPVMRDLKASLIERGAAKPAGQTWGDFQQAMAALGITAETRLASIEWGTQLHGTNHLVADETEFGIEVREL